MHGKSQRMNQRQSWQRVAFAGALTLLAAACTTVRAPAPAPAGEAVTEPGRPTRVAPALPAAGSGRGGYYLDDGPGDAPPPNLLATPDPEPTIEPYSMRGNRPYSVFGKTYTPLTDNRPLKQRGMGSWYGKKFHGQKTASGELYDMYKMTAAHPTLPIPSYARVTNVKNGAQVIVRVNDRGPFHSSRIIDLSYTAALKLGYIGYGSADLEVERLLPDEIARMKRGGGNPVALLAQPARAMLTTTPAALTPPPPVPTLARQATNLTPRMAFSLVPLATPPQPGAPAPYPGQSLDDFLQSQAANGTGMPPVALMSVASEPVASTEIAAVMSTPAAEVADGVAAPASAPPAPGGFYLQFGAYAQSANANALRERLMQSWPASLPALEVQQSGAVYRLYSGPFGSRDAAQQAAALSSIGLAKPLIVQR